MDITVSSRQVPVSAALRAAVEEKVSRLSRFVDELDRAEVHFAEQRNRRSADREVCEVTLLGGGHRVRAKVTAADPFAAVDAAVAKLEHQLHHLKSKLLTRHQGRRRAGAGDGEAAAATAGGPAGTGTAEAGTAAAAAREAPTVAADSDEGPERFPLVVGVADEQRVVKTKRFTMKPMTPDEAILQMELLSHQFFLFVNAHTGLLSVIYRRDDGDIGLIEPAP